MESIVNLFKHQVVTNTRLEMPISENPVIFYKGRALEEGVQYIISGNVLVIRANFLLSLPSHPLGEVAVLLCKFPSGAKWKIRVIQVDKTAETTEAVPSAAPAPVNKSKATRFAIGGVGVLAVAVLAKVLLRKKK